MSEIIWGITNSNHDASLAVSYNGEIVFAAQAERYSRIKNDHYLNEDIIKEALVYGQPKNIILHETPWKKRLRILRSGDWKHLLEYNPWKNLNLETKYQTENHHHSHAAAGFYSSNFKDALIIVFDAIGENQSQSLYKGSEQGLELLEMIPYPNSLGLFYSACTQAVGLKPNEDEYIFMGMAAYGDKNLLEKRIHRDFIEHWSPQNPELKLKFNPHRGIKINLRKEDYFNFAATVQSILESFVIDYVISKIKKYNCRNIIFSGGVALNCVLNSKLANLPDVNNFHVFGNPGDSGNAIGAIAAFRKKHFKLNNLFLGHEIDKDYPMQELLDELHNNKIVGIANGKTEFGPRALGNRSILADPRGKEMQNQLNQLKNRQNFRPFAPVILEDYFNHCFDTNLKESPFMQYVVKCKNPNDYPAICHIDNTSRVQTVNQENNPNLYELLKNWFKQTGCPMLVNTSLNVKGKPIVNNEKDAKRFEEINKIKVL
jgi:carbamoyltransferase